MRLLYNQTGRIGDMILSTPVFQAVKEKFPDCLFDVITGNHNWQIIKNNPNINQIFILDKSPLKLCGFIREIRSNRYDYFIDPRDHHSTEGSIIARLVKANTKIGFNREGEKTYDYSLPSSEENSGKHRVQICMNSLAPLGIEQGNQIPRPQLFISQDSEEYVRDFLAIIHKPFILFNISSGRPERQLQKSKWDTLIKSVKEEAYSLVITHAPEDNELSMQLQESLRVPFFFKSRSIEDVIALVSKAKALISPDTSLIHIAAAFDLPVFGLFGNNPQNYSKFRPLSSVYKVVQPMEASENVNGIDMQEAIIKCNIFIKKLLNG